MPIHFTGVSSLWQAFPFHHLIIHPRRLLLLSLELNCTGGVMLQFSFSFTTSFLFRLTPLVATGEDSAPRMILALLSWDLHPSSYLTSSSLIFGLIISSAGSLTPVCIPRFHPVLLSSIRFLYRRFLGPCALVHSI